MTVSVTGRAERGGARGGRAEALVDGVAVARAVRPVALEAAHVEELRVGERRLPPAAQPLLSVQQAIDAAERLLTAKESVARCGMRTLSGLKLTLRFAVCVHGRRSCCARRGRRAGRRRQSRAAPGSASSSARIRPASAGSAVRAGSKTKARSLA
jgi:hypothetical protein